MPALQPGSFEASLLAGLVGLAVGSFLNVCVDRLPRGQSLVCPPSHCDSCQRALGALDIVPVLSFLWLRGRCRYCGAAIPWRVPLVELLAGVVFAGIVYSYGVGLHWFFLVVFFSLLIVVSFIDLEHKVIPDLVVYPGVLVALAFAWFVPGLGILRSVEGGGVAFTLFLAIYVLARGGMGFGDVKLALLVGLITGFPQVMVSVALSFVSGGAVALALLASRRRGRRDLLPFGVFLSIGAGATLLWGEDILGWYLGLFG